LKMIEGWWGANEHMVLGDIVHEHADLPVTKSSKGALFQVPCRSGRTVGLSGKCDIARRARISDGVLGGAVGVHAKTISRRRLLAAKDAPCSTATPNISSRQRPGRVEHHRFKWPAPAFLVFDGTNIAADWIWFGTGHG
jgi:hypothetical protein